MAARNAARRWWGLGAVALGVALIVIDTTIVNVIMPSLIEDLRISSVQAQWVQVSYAIAFAALLLLTGRLADLRGARLMFQLGLAVFGVTSVVAALSVNGGMLIGARFGQGIGAAILLPSSLALINNNFSGAERGKAFAVWGSTIGAGAAVGPLLGGWLDEISWRWVFGINVALVVVVFVGVRRFVDESARVRGGVDTAGALLSVLGLGLLAFALVEGRTYGWISTTGPLSAFGLTWASGPSPVLVAVLVAAAALAALVWWQVRLTARTGGEPLVRTTLFTIASFRGGNIATLLIGLGEFGILAVVPLWLQFTLGYTPVQAGLALAVLCVGSFVASGASFALAVKLLPVTLVRAGLLLETAGLVVLALVAAADTPWWAIAIALFVYGIGVGFATAQVTNVVLADVPAEDSGAASGAQSAVRQLGSALGIGLLTTVFYTSFAGRIGDALAALPGTGPGLGDSIVNSGGAALPALGERPETAAIAAAGRTAMSTSISVTGYLCAGLLVLGLLATALIRGGRPPAAARPDVTAHAHQG